MPIRPSSRNIFFNIIMSGPAELKYKKILAGVDFDTVEPEWAPGSRPLLRGRDQLIPAHLCSHWGLHPYCGLPLQTVIGSAHNVHIGQTSQVRGRGERERAKNFLSPASKGSRIKRNKTCQSRKTIFLPITPFSNLPHFTMHCVSIQKVKYRMSNYRQKVW